MTINNNNEVFLENLFNISHNLEKLIDGFKFHIDPRDGIKDVRLKTLTIGVSV